MFKLIKLLYEFYKPKKKEYKIQSIGSKSNSQSGNINDLVSKKKDDKNVNSVSFLNKF